VLGRVRKNCGRKKSMKTRRAMGSKRGGPRKNAKVSHAERGDREKRRVDNASWDNDEVEGGEGSRPRRKDDPRGG